MDLRKDLLDFVLFSLHPESLEGHELHSNNHGIDVFVKKIVFVERNALVIVWNFLSGTSLLLGEIGASRALGESQLLGSEKEVLECTCFLFLW